MRRLLILDGSPFPAPLPPGENYLMRLGSEAAFAGTQEVELAPLAERAHEEVTQFLLELPRLLARSLKALLGRDWWYLELLERNATRSPLPELLYRLSLIRQTITAHGIAEVWVANPALAQALQTDTHLTVRSFRVQPAAPPPSYLRQALRATASFWAARWALRRLPRAPFAVEGQPLYFTFFPYFWLKLNSPGPQERFLPASPGPWLTWLSGASSWRGKPAELAAHFQRLKLIPLQKWLSLLAPLTFFCPRRLSRLAATRRQRLQVGYLGFELGPVVEDQLAASLVSPEYFLGVLLERAVHGYLEQNNPACLIYRLEHQPYETALLQGSTVPTFGYRHSVMWPYLVSHRFHPDEIRESVQEAPGAMPLPGRFWVAGARGRELLLREGIPPERVVECGPQRHVELVDFAAAQPDRQALRQALLARLDASEPAIVVMVVLGLRAAENAAVLAVLRELLLRQPTLRCLVRSHPASPEARFEPTPQLAWQARGEPVYPALAACDAVVTPGSTMAFEAMALGVFPIVHEDPASFAFYSLAGYTDCLFVTHSQAALQEAIEAIVEDRDEATRRRGLWPEKLRAIFGDRDRPLPEQLAQAVRESLQR